MYLGEGTYKDCLAYYGGAFYFKTSVNDRADSFENNI